MRARTRHPRLTAIACSLYGLAIWIYPADFRRAFGHELAVTFRNQVEEVLDGGMLQWLAFAAHITFDWIQTCTVLRIESRTQTSVSLLAIVPVQLIFPIAGLVVTLIGWYAFFVVVLSSAGVSPQP